jgi:hypothetical protein
MASTRSVHMPGSGSSSQAHSSRASSTIGVRLRRRLSSSFQRDSGVSGFGGAPGSVCTRARSQPSSCQSPRIQRWRRAASTA